MENPTLKPEVLVDSHPLKKLAEKMVSDFEGVNLAMKDLRKESDVNTRLGVVIDWSKGTMIVEANK